jgi:hypothetical protein
MKHKGIMQREFKSGFIPYVSLFGLEAKSLPIKRIIVGPHNNRKYSAGTLVKFLQLKDMKIEVTVSATPLR